MTTPEERLHKLGIALPPAIAPRYSYVPVVHHAGLMYVSGQVPRRDGELAVTGAVGAEVSLEQAREAARICALNALAQLAELAGGLDRIERIVRVTGYVASAPGFFEQPRVLDGASELLVEVLGEGGRHARSAVGVSALPSNVPVEIELIAAAS